MNISKISNAYEIYKTQTQALKHTSRPEVSEEAYSPSEIASDFTTALKSVREAQSLRLARIDEIKIEIQNGTYFVPTAKVASKIIRG